MPNNKRLIKKLQRICNVSKSHQLNPKMSKILRYLASVRYLHFITSLDFNQIFTPCIAKPKFYRKKEKKIKISDENGESFLNT